MIILVTARELETATRAATRHRTAALGPRCRDEGGHEARVRPAEDHGTASRKESAATKAAATRQNARAAIQVGHRRDSACELEAETRVSSLSLCGNNRKIEPK